MTPEMWAAILSPIASAIFAAGAAAGAVTWRFRALEGRITLAEDAIVEERMRLDRHIEGAAHVSQ